MVVKEVLSLITQPNRMSIKDILNQYHVIFSTSKDFALSNRIETVNSWLSQFIGNHYTLIEANRLLNGVNEILVSNDSNSYDFDT